MKAFLKDVRAASEWRAWRTGLWRLLPARITVLVYHRVTDDTRDAVSIGLRQFDRQMSLLRSHFRPISVEDVVSWSALQGSKRPVVAVTFDDGYRDNFENAAPILSRHGIPAAFFVSTGIVGTDRRFPHDIKRGNPVIPNMSWDQVRALRDSGFAVGSHTVNHIDCAAVPEQTLRLELEQSRDHLRQQLGVDDPVFAYPYGRRDNMTIRALELVKETGYAACFSAYGGSNGVPVNRFNVRRRAIHWKMSDQVFLATCLGLGMR